MKKTNKWYIHRRGSRRFAIRKDLLTKLSEYCRKLWHRFLGLKLKYRVLVILAILILTDFMAIIQPFLVEKSYALGSAESLLEEKTQAMANKISYSQKDGTFTFKGGASSTTEARESGNTAITSVVHKDASKGMSVTDTINSVGFSMTPKFRVDDGRQDSNRIVYPLTNGNSGWLVYTMEGTGIKEDILLTKSDGNDATFTYSLDLGDNLAARVESDGSIGIYGNTLLSGNVATSSDADSALLEKARKNATKNTFLFGIPKPEIIESGKKTSSVHAKFELSGTTLTLHVSNLKAGHYPLTIDPSIYVVTAQQFMAGNNETNVNFDVANKLIKKGRTTGARFDSWTTTSNLPTGEWGGATVGAGGYIYTVGGTTFTGQVYTSQGADTYTVPSGVTSLTVKMWGGGGGGGGGGATNVGGAGGGGGYVTETITVTPGEVLNVYVGGGGTGGAYNSGGSDAGGGGGGGGYSSLYRSTTALAIAAGGGGGGGARNATIGAAGGAGGGTSGIIGSTVSGGGAGGPGLSGSGGAAGTGTNTAVAGTSLTGGAGADGRSSNSTDGTGAARGLASGGNGGLANASGNTYAAGGGGGAGLFGGGGGGGSANTNGQSGGGGGGGSSYTIAGATGVTNSAGSGTSPGNSSDSYRAGAGDGGAGGAALTAGTTGDNGIVVITYGAGMAPSQSVSWAQLNTGSGTIDSANPGSGACSGWCTTSAYNLPSERSNFSLVAYNGFLYAIGGVDASGTRQSTVYTAKLGANGEPQLWHPSNADKSTWVYWYADTGLSSTRSSFGAVAYNNRMYIIGGLTGTGSGSVVNTTQYASINPNGTLGSWSSGTNLPSAVYGHDVQVYNDRLYVIGGAASVGGAPITSVYYNKINSDGSINSWQSTTPMNNARMQVGGNFSVVWGAYLYVSGGCDAVSGSYCTSIRSDTQVASINADGSLDIWNIVGNVTDQRMGHSLFAWRDNIYLVGGCSLQNTDGTCDTNSMLKTINYGTINQDGEASTVADSVARGTAPCSGANPKTCNLPGTTYIGNVLTGSAIMNGYLYIWGGCSNSNAGCTSVSRGVIYTSIGSDGSLTKPASCGTWTAIDSYCYNSTSLPAGFGAPGATVANGYIYSVGGFTTSGMIGNIYYTAPDATNGSISSWAAADLTTIGASDVSYTYSFTRANASQASTIPNNLYIVGGCIGATGVGCPSTGGYTQRVYKCNLSTAGVPSSCDYTTQLQIGTVSGATAAGLGAMAGTVYANYIYLMGGLAQGATDLKTTRYAKIDDNNNIVAVSGSAWVESPNLTYYGRRRGSGFGYNGYLYVVGGYDGSGGGGGVLADIEFAKINVSDGSIGTWNVSTVSINQRWGLTMTVSNSFAYVIGGCISGAAPTCDAAGQTNSVQTFQVYNNDSGVPASYSTSSNTYATDPNRIGVSSVIANGYIYAAGGCTGIVDCMNPVTTVSYAPIDTSGNIGSWSNTTAALPAARAWGKLLTAGGSLYYVGGQDTTGTSQSTVYWATPSSGNVSTWNTATSGLPASRTEFGATVWNNRLYVVGGSTGVSNTIVYNTAGASTFVVPSGVSSITVKAWGAGGGGGNGNSSTGTGGAGGGGGFAQSTLTVTPSESLTVNVGTGGAKAAAASNGGNGGGFSALLRSGTYLIQAGGGGGGGGSVGTNTNNGGAGGAGGGASGVIGAVGAGTATLGGAGGPGTAAAGGAGGALGSSGAAGYSGTNNLGGDAGGSGATCATVVTTRGGNGGTGGGGKGGTAGTCVGGGGGGGGRYGGGGGGSATNTSNRGSGGGGGGSDYVTGTSNTETVGSGTTPGQSTDALHVGTAGVGGTGSTSTASTAGSDGEVVITYNTMTPTSTVYVSPQLNSGGDVTSWSSSSTAFNVARSGATVIAYANNLYLLGGYDGANYLNDTQYAQIDNGVAVPANAGLITGTWTDSESLPTPMANGDGFAVNGYIYLVGGRSADTTCTPSTLVAPISANTTIASGNNPTGVGVWYETNQRYTGSRYGNAAVYNDGKAYVLGGGCGAQTTYASPVTQQTTLLTQPQVAKYSIMFDADSDVYPNKWLLNGLDNSIGARWQLKYQSMTNPTSTGPNGTGKNCSSTVMGTWGQTTNFGNVTLMQPGVYTALDGSGTNTNCARYYYFSISIDSSQAFGYPDDVSRGPTITDLTLNFTADPAKRLMHGRTFVGGLQMPDDTPYYSN